MVRFLDYHQIHIGALIYYAALPASINLNHNSSLATEDVGVFLDKFCGA